MTDFFKNNPMALRHCLLYEYLRKSRVERIFDAFPIVFGDDVIKKEEYQVWFDQFKQGIFDTNDSKEPITDMRGVLRRDRYALRACIFYETLKYKQVERGSPISHIWPDSNIADRKVQCDPSFFMYNNFCDVLGDDVMEFRVFDFWFYRFLNGEFDWSFEKVKDEKILELSDMPIDIMENIVEYLDIFDRVNLAKTSHSLQSFVKDQKLFHHTLKLSISYLMATDSLSSSVDIKYIRNGDECLKNYKKSKTLVREIEFYVSEVIYLDDEYVLNDLKDELKFTHYLNVKNLILEECSWETVATILPILKPEYLTTINFNYLNSNPVSMYKVFEMEQWKQAKYFKMDDAYFIWPLHHLYHFKMFHVILEELKMEDIRQMKEVLFKSPDFEECRLVFPDLDFLFIVEQEFGNFLRDNPHKYHYSIPNSTECFEITAAAWTLKVQKQK